MRRDRQVSVAITEKPYDPDDGGPVFIIRVDMNKRVPWTNTIYEGLDERGSPVVDQIRDWCVDQWDGEEYAFNPFDGKEIWVRSLAQAMAFKFRWDGKHAVA